MKKISIILSVLFCAVSYAQAQPSIVYRSSSAVTVSDARLRGQLNFYLPRTHGLTLNGGLDTLGAMIYEDSSQHVWFRDTVISGGHKWTMFPTLVNVQSPLQWQNQGINIGTLGQASTINFIGSGVTATYSSGTIIVSITGPTSGGIISINGDTTHNQIFVNGFAGTKPNIISAAGTTTFNIPIVSSVDTGQVTPALFNTWNNKQSALSFATPTSTTLTLSAGWANSIIGSGATINLPSILSPGSCTNCNLTFDANGRVTVYANGSAAAGTVTSVGLSLPSIFNVTVSPITTSGTLTAVLANACANCVFGVNAGSPTTPTMFLPTAATLDNWFGQTIGTITGLIGDGTTSGSGLATLTLATVNTNTGTWGSASTVPQFTVIGKGLITAVSPVSIQINESQVTNLVTDLAAKLTNVLPSGQIFVGNGSNLAVAVAMSGDATISNAGVLALASVITLGSCTNCILTYDAKGRIVAAASAPNDSVYALNGLTANGTDTLVWGGRLIQNTSISAANARTLTFDSLSSGLFLKLLSNKTPSGTDSMLIVNTSGQVFKAVISSGGGGGTAAGSTGDVQIKNANGLFSTLPSSLFHIDSTNTRLGIGIAAPVSTLQIVDLGTSTVRGLTVSQYNTGTNGARISMDKFRGTVASPTTLVTGDALGSYTWRGYDGTNSIEAAKIIATSTGTIGTGQIPSIMALQTANSAGTLTTGISIASTQVLTFPAYTTNAGILFTNGSGVLAQGTAPAHAGMRPSWDGTTINWTDTATGGGGSGWSLTGNAGTNSGINFAGTTDAKTFVLGANGLKRIFIDSLGFVGFNAIPNKDKIVNDSSHLWNFINDNTPYQEIAYYSIGASVFQNNIHYYRYGGTYGSPTQTLGGWDYFSFGTRGYGVSSMLQSNLAFQGITAENQTTSTMGAYFQFDATPKGTAARNHAIRFYGDTIVSYIKMKATGLALYSTDSSTVNAASALLTMNSTTQGILIPRMTGAQISAISSPATGLMAYNTTNNLFYFYTGSQFDNLADPGFASGFTWTGPQVFSSTITANGAVTVNSTESIVAGTLASGVNAFSVTGTQASTLTGNSNGVNILTTTAGSGNTGFDHRGIFNELVSGYTGTDATTALYSYNIVNGTGTSVTGGTVNMAAHIVASPTGTTGTEVAMLTLAGGGNINYGSFFQATVAKNSASNIGFASIAANTGTSPIIVGGYIGLRSTDPTFATSAAFIVDNGAISAPIALFQASGTTAIDINSTGKLLLGNGTTDNSTGLIQSTSTTAQLALHYDATHDAVFLVSSTGNLTVTPTGGSTTIVSTSSGFVSQKNSTAAFGSLVSTSGADSWTFGFLTNGTAQTNGSAIRADSSNNIILQSGGGAVQYTSFAGGVAYASSNTITSGTSSTIANAIINTYINPASLIAAYTLTLPSAPLDGTLVQVFGGGTITGGGTVVTAFTISANSGQTITQGATGITTLLAGACYIYQYNAADNSWYRKQ